MKTLSLGYSPCPNDTYIFRAIAQGVVQSDQVSLDIRLADVEELNVLASRGALDISKVSAAAVTRMLDTYGVLPCGGALGYGCGPLLVARESVALKDLRNAVIAIPGRRTTANLLLELSGEHEGHKQEMLFSDIPRAVQSGQVDAGLIIHESRFTYASLGLKKILDLGEWWEHNTGLPLPLGVIVARRDLGPEMARHLAGLIRQSIEHTRAHPDEAQAYIRGHAQEMEPGVISEHIATFVNDFSLNMGPEGLRALEILLEKAFALEGKTLPGNILACD